MDLVDHSQARFDEVVAEFESFAPILRRDGRRAGHQYEIIYIPISALYGDNVVERSQAMGWYDDPATRHCSSCSSRSTSPTTIPTTGRRAFPCSG